MAEAFAAETNGAEIAAGVANHWLDALTILPEPVAIALVVMIGLVALAFAGAAGLAARWKWGPRPTTAQHLGESDSPPVDDTEHAEALHVLIEVVSELTRSLETQRDTAERAALADEHMAKRMDELVRLLSGLPNCVTACPKAVKPRSRRPRSPKPKEMPA